MNKEIIFHQLFERETSTYTYLLGDPDSKEAILIDPVFEMVDRDLKLIQELGLKLVYVLDTHVHADHVTASGVLKARTGAKVGISAAYEMGCTDVALEDGAELTFGACRLKAFHTPGHTKGCMTYQVGDRLFTGDALLIRGCGRTDFQEGCAERLYTSVHEKIFTHPDHFEVYPAHDYKGFTKSSLALERSFNPRLGLNVSKEKFVEIMANLKLDPPKKIHEAVPANLVCGLKN